MQDGFYPDLPAADYFALPDRISVSTLRAHRMTGAHARHHMDEDRVPTAAMLKGSLVHTLILEPEKLASRFAFGPDVSRATKEWKAWAMEQPEGVALLKESDLAEAVSMCKWLDDMPTIAHLVKGAGPVEASVLWSETDALTGTTLRFRARPDKLVGVAGSGILVDLKTCADISTRALERTIYDRGYHLQMAHYMRGLAAVGQTVEHAVLIFIESSAPHTARAMLMAESWLDAANAELNSLRVRHAECLAKGEWQGWPDAIIDTEAPVWLTAKEGVVL